MTLDEKIGQRFIVGLAGPKIDEEFISLVKDYHIANVILFSRNIEDRQQLAQLCSEIQQLVMHETGHGAFITIDQEGGAVTRLPKDMINCPGAMAIAATGDPKNAYEAARITAEELRAVGINFNLAPDLDINCNPDNPVIGVRSFGDTSETVIEYGMNAIKGFTDGNILSCAKHFPGHGDTAVDSHVGLPCIEKSKQELLELELLPFIKAIENDVPAVMSSHILFPKIEPDNIPATMSRRIITELLKEELGFRGLVISDCMEMDAIKKYYGSVNGIEEAFKAGVDMVFVSHTAALAKLAVNRVKKAYEDGVLSVSELDECIDKIIKYKEQYADLQPHTDKTEYKDTETFKRNQKHSLEIRRASLTCMSGEHIMLGDDPVFIGCDDFRASIVSSDADKDLSFARYLCKKLGGRCISTSPNPDDAELESIARKLGNPTSIIYATCNGHINNGQIMVGRWLATRRIPMAAFALRNPYDLLAYPEHVTKYAIWEYTENSLKVIEELLSGKIEARGRMPIKV